MDFTFLRFLFYLVEQEIIISFRVTKDKIYVIIKNNRPS